MVFRLLHTVGCPLSPRDIIPNLFCVSVTLDVISSLHIMSAMKFMIDKNDGSFDLFCNCTHCRHKMRSREQRHNAGVDNTKAFDTIHLQVLTHDTAVVARAHLARPGRMIKRLCAGAYVLLQSSVARNVAFRNDF